VTSVACLMRCGTCAANRNTDLLRSYRITHARVQYIDPFEKVLRETTPCVSIQDPAGFTEYLNNLSLRSDMTMEEFKRVSKELADTKAKLAEQQKETEARDKEIDRLKARVTELESQTANLMNGDSKPTNELSLQNSHHSEKEIRTKSPGTMSISDLKPTEDSSVDFFSFEDEHG